MIGSYDPSGWRCVAHNPSTGVSTWIIPDGDEDVLIQERQDISALLDENTAQRNIASDNWKGDGLHSVARIPLIMAHEKDGFVHGALKAGDGDALAKFLNDGDYAKLRTKEGQL